MRAEPRRRPSLVRAGRTNPKFPGHLPSVEDRKGIGDDRGQARTGNDPHEHRVDWEDADTAANCGAPRLQDECTDCERNTDQSQGEPHIAEEPGGPARRRRSPRRNHDPGLGSPTWAEPTDCQRGPQRTRDALLLRAHGRAACSRPDKVGLNDSDGPRALEFEPSVNRETVYEPPGGGVDGGAVEGGSGGAPLRARVRSPNTIPITTTAKTTPARTAYPSDDGRPRNDGALE